MEAWQIWALTALALYVVAGLQTYRVMMLTDPDPANPMKQAELAGSRDPAFLTTKFLFLAFWPLVLGFAFLTSLGGMVKDHPDPITAKNTKG